VIVGNTGDDPEQWSHRWAPSNATTKADPDDEHSPVLRGGAAVIKNSALAVVLRKTQWEIGESAHLATKCVLTLDHCAIIVADLDAVIRLAKQYELQLRTPAPTHADSDAAP
jgi:hypothetical protein